MSKKKATDKATTKTKIKVTDIICYVCAAMFCAVPFVPFVDELDIEPYANKLGELEVRTYIVSHLVLNQTWYAYFTIVIAILVFLATIKKNTPLRLIMMGSIVIETVVLVVRANQLVMKIFTGDLYEPSVGYYMLLAASSIVIIITLISLMKEKNASTAKNDETIKVKSDNKLGPIEESKN